jgi:hypothetical protein
MALSLLAQSKVAYANDGQNADCYAREGTCMVLRTRAWTHVRSFRASQRDPPCASVEDIQPHATWLAELMKRHARKIGGLAIVGIGASVRGLEALRRLF